VELQVGQSGLGLARQSACLLPRRLPLDFCMGWLAGRLDGPEKLLDQLLCAWWVVTDPPALLAATAPALQTF